jgi:hypothetical protein
VYASSCTALCAASLHGNVGLAISLRTRAEKKKKKVQKTTGKTQAWNKGEGEMAPSFFLWNLETAYARVTIKIRLYIIYSISQINIPVAWLSFWHLCGTIFP